MESAHWNECALNARHPCRFPWGRENTGLRKTAAPWIAENLKNALIINVLLAIFTLLPLPPLDGGRIAVGVLPDALAVPLARLEPYGMVILIGVLFILPFLGAQLGVDLNIVWQLVIRSTNAIIGVILRLTGNAQSGAEYWVLLQEPFRKKKPIVCNAVGHQLGHCRDERSPDHCFGSGP